MEEILIFATVIAPIILALVQLLKKTAGPNANYIPLIAVAVGLVVGAASAPFSDLDIFIRLWAGGIAGLASTGLFELADKAKDEIDED